MKTRFYLGGRINALLARCHTDPAGAVIHLVQLGLTRERAEAYVEDALEYPDGRVHRRHDGEISACARDEERHRESA